MRVLFVRPVAPRDLGRLLSGRHRGGVGSEVLDGQARRGLADRDSLEHPADGDEHLHDLADVVAGQEHHGLVEAAGHEDLLDDDLEVGGVQLRVDVAADLVQHHLRDAVRPRVVRVVPLRQRADVHRVRDVGLDAADLPDELGQRLGRLLLRVVVEPVAVETHHAVDRLAVTLEVLEQRDEGGQVGVVAVEPGRHAPDLHLPAVEARCLRDRREREDHAVFVAGHGVEPGGAGQHLDGFDGGDLLHHVQARVERLEERGHEPGHRAGVVEHVVLHRDALGQRVQVDVGHHLGEEVGQAGGRRGDVLGDGLLESGGDERLGGGVEAAADQGDGLVVLGGGGGGGLVLVELVHLCAPLRKM